MEYYVAISTQSFANAMILGGRNNGLIFLGELLIFFLRHRRGAAGGAARIPPRAVNAAAGLEAWNLATASTVAIRRLFSSVI